MPTQLPTPASEWTDEEEELWDQLFDTDAMRSCPCPSCNHYLPPGQYKPDETCEVVALIYKIIEKREEQARGAA
jgi:hypothetical protein